MAANTIQILITAKDQASKQIEEVSKASGQAAKGTSRLSSAMATAGKIAIGAAATGFAALTTGVVTASKAAWDQVKAVEEGSFALRAYEKDADKVTKILGDLVAYARSDMGVLFQREDLFKAASNLRGFGEEADKVTGRVKILSKGVALGMTNFDELSQIVGRAASAGKLTAEQYDQLAYRGIILDKSLRGASVGADKLYQSLDKALPDDILKGRADTIQGRLIRLQSAFREVGLSILGVDRETSKFIEGGLGDRLVKAMSSATQVLRDMAPTVATVVTGILDFTDATAKFVRGAAQKARDALQWISDRLESVKRFLGDVAGAFAELKQKGIDVINRAIDDSKKKWQDFKGWLEEHQETIKTTVTILGLIFGPALAKAAFEAVVAATKIAASGVASGAGWVKGAAIASAAWVAHQAKMTALSAGVRILIVKDAIVAGAAWVKAAVTAAVGWVVNMARVSVAMTGTAIVAAAKAADAGWAWAINGTRATIVWLTQLPRVIASFIATSTAAIVEATKSAGAWAAAAIRSALAWLAQLPRIISTFVATTASATTNALATSASWVAAALRSAAAWVVTALPRIVGAFVAMAASAATNALAASAVWVASTVKASAAVKALAALVAIPMVMPAIAIGAAIAALAAVISKAREARQAVEGAKEAAASNVSAAQKMRDQAAQGLKDGTRTQAQHDELVRIANNLEATGRKGLASGTNYAPGGLTLVGERGPELVNLPRGSQVTQAYRTQQALSGGAGGDITINFTGPVSFSDRSDIDYFAERMNKTQRLARVGMA